MMHLCGLWKEWVSEEGMLHHCHGRLREEWDREWVVVASLMQQGIELAVGKMMHHWAYGKNGLAKEECCITVTGRLREELDRERVVCCIVDATQYGARCREDDTSVWPTKECISVWN